MSENFSYRYSANERSEVESIRERYVDREQTKLEKLKKLDESVRGAGMIESLCLGVLGVLIFGVGMCMGLGAIPGGMIFAVIIGIVGAIVMAPAYILYLTQQRRAREKYTPEILRLAEEICGDGAAESPEA